MKQQALAHFTDIYLIAIAFFLFLSVFVGYIFWLCRKGSKNIMTIYLNCHFMRRTGHE